MTTTATETASASSAAVDYTTFDADNHYYEATDAYTRHIDKAMAKRAMQWAEINGRQRLLVGGKVNRFIPNPLFDPVAKPGSLDEYFRGKNPEAQDIRSLFGDLEPIRPEYRDRDARLSVMDRQGLDGCFLFPTLGVGMEEALADDPAALVAAFEAFNRWLEDDWGYAYKERIFAAPMITLIDVDAAVAELRRVLEADARIVCIKGGPAHTPTGLISPADTRFDPFWGLVNESGVTVGIHSGDAGYGRYLNDWEPSGDFEAFRYSPLRTVLSSDRPPFETMAAFLCQGLFDRFPRVRVASIEVWRELGVRADQETEEGVQPDAGIVPIGPGRKATPARLGRSLLRGQPGSAEGVHRYGTHPVWFRLATRRRAGGTTQLRVGPPTPWIQRGRNPHRHGRKRLGSDAPGRPLVRRQTAAGRRRFVLRSRSCRI